MSEKKMEFPIGKEVETFQLELSWDIVKENEEIDLDASCVLFNHDGALIDAVYYNQLEIDYLEHSGDDKDGEGVGPDEVISIELVGISEAVAAFVFVINCKTGNFEAVGKAKCEIADVTNEAPVVMDSVDLGLNGKETGYLFCMIYRKRKDGEWNFREIGAATDCRFFGDMEKDMRKELEFLIPKEKQSSKTKKFQRKKHGWRETVFTCESLIQFEGEEREVDSILVLFDMFGGKVGCWAPPRSYGLKDRNLLNLRHDEDSDDPAFKIENQVRVNPAGQNFPSEVAVVVLAAKMHDPKKTFSELTKDAVASIRSDHIKPDGPQKLQKIGSLKSVGSKNFAVLAIYAQKPKPKHVDDEWKMMKTIVDFGDCADMVFDLPVTDSISDDQDNMAGCCREAAQTVVGTRLFARNRGQILNRQREKQKWLEATMAREPEKRQKNPSESEYSEFAVKFRGKNLPVLDRGGSSDPFFKFVGMWNDPNKHDADIENRYTSETIKKELNPSWKEFVWKFPNSYLTPPTDDVRRGAIVYVELYDWDKLSRDDYMGNVVFGVGQVMNLKTPKEFELMVTHEEKKKKGKKGKEELAKVTKGTGKLVVEKFELKEAWVRNEEHFKAVEKLREVKKWFEKWEPMIKTSKKRGIW